MRKKYLKVLFLGISLFYILFFACIFGESKIVVRNKLDVYAKEELNFLCKEIPDSAVSDSPYFKIIDFTYRAGGMPFTYFSTVDFYYFKKIKMKQIRKYRYINTDKKWDTYAKDFINIP